MNLTRKVLLGACFVVVLMAAMRVKAQMSEDAGRKEIEAFNKRHVEIAPEDGYGGSVGVVDGGRS